MLALLVLVVAGIGLTSPRDRLILQQLGLWDGWRCLHTATFVYEPRWRWLAGGLLAEAPDASLPNDVQTVEVSLRTGEAVARSKDRVYVLQPGQLTVVTDPNAQELRPLCLTQLRQWQIVGEHALG